MSISLYDELIKKKIQSWIIDPKLTLLGVNESRRFFEWRADITNDKPLDLPLISISRGSQANIKLTAKRPMAYMGKVFNSDGNSSDHLNAVPIDLTYQLDIYTRYLTEADEYVRNFVFNIINHPAMKMQIPYNKSTLEYTSFMTLGPTITDNSDIPERLIPGQFSRMSLTIQLMDAYLFSYNIQAVPKIDSIAIEDGRTGEIAAIINNDNVEEN